MKVLPTPPRLLQKHTECVGGGVHGRGRGEGGAGKDAPEEGSCFLREGPTGADAKALEGVKRGGCARVARAGARKVKVEGERGRVPRARRLWFGTKRRGSAKVGTLNKRDSWRITELFSVGHPADHSRTVLGMRAWSDARTPRVATRAAFLSPFAFATVAQRTRGVASAPGPPPRSAIPVHARSRDPRIGDGDDADRARRSRPSGCGVVASPARQGETRVHLPRRARGPRGVLHHARRGRERRHRRARAPGGVPPPRHPRHARAVPTKGVRGGPRRERSGGVPRVRPARDHHHHPRRRSVRVR